MVTCLTYLKVATGDYVPEKSSNWMYAWKQMWKQLTMAVKGEWRWFDGSPHAPTFE